MPFKEPTSEKSPENQTSGKIVSDSTIATERRRKRSAEGRDELEVTTDLVFPDGGLRAWLVVLGVCRIFPFAFIFCV